MRADSSGSRRAGTSTCPRRGPVLLVSNHLSVLDPPLVGGARPRAAVLPGQGRAVRDPAASGGSSDALNARPVRRDGADGRRAARRRCALLEEGRALLVFPEGTRGVEGVLREAKPGAGMLAVLSGAPVVPVYVTGSGAGAGRRGERFRGRPR